MSESDDLTVMRRLNAPNFFDNDITEDEMAELRALDHNPAARRARFLELREKYRVLNPGPHSRIAGQDGSEVLEWFGLKHRPEGKAFFPPRDDSDYDEALEGWNED